MTADHDVEHRARINEAFALIRADFTLTLSHPFVQ
jgi:hypothetical protein